MSELGKMLREKKDWYANFKAMPFGEKTCDSGCGKPPKEWFGNTSCATCGDAKCIAYQQREYDANVRSRNEEEDWW